MYTHREPVRTWAERYLPKAGCARSIVHCYGRVAGLVDAPGSRLVGTKGEYPF